MSAIAVRQSAEGIVDEKSVGKIPPRRDRRRPERCAVPNGPPKGSGKYDSRLLGLGPYGPHDLRSSNVETSGLESA